jgi:hypothetical protein
VLAGKDIKQIFANFSGHLHKDGHQLMARAIFEIIEQERAALGLPEPNVAIAGQYPAAKTTLPAALSEPAKP